MSVNFRWYNLPNQRVMAKMDIAPGLIYVVNFIEDETKCYTCFFYPSVSSQNQMALTNPTKSMSDIQIQEKIYVTLRNVLRDFADKYNPESITFAPQFHAQLTKITSATIPGYHTEYTPGKRLMLTKRN